MFLNAILGSNTKTMDMILSKLCKIVKDREAWHAQSSSVQLLSPVLGTLSVPVDCSMPGFPVHHQIPSLFKLKSIELMMPSNCLILCCPLLLLPSIILSISVFSNESVLRSRWPKYWSFSFSISPSNEYLGLISFRMEWLDLLAPQRTLKSLLQHHSSKASILQHSPFVSPTLMSICDCWKNDRRNFVGKVMTDF